NGHGQIVTSERRGFEPRASELSPSHSTGALRLAGLGLAASLPPSLAQKQALAHPKDSESAHAQPETRVPMGRPLPGMPQGQPLPPLPGRLSTARAMGSYLRSRAIQMPAVATPTRAPLQPVQTPSANLAVRVPSPAAAVQPSPPPPRPAAAAIAWPPS